MTYELVEVKGQRGIRCLICGKTSHHPEDVTNLYCGGCRAFHSTGKGAMSPYPPHKCHAIGCKREIAPKFLMCPPHWRLVPKEIQREIWRRYRPGQEIDKRPSTEYIYCVREAQLAVQKIEASRGDRK